MPIEGFDYKAFALDLAKQAVEVLQQPNSNAAPSNLTVQDKKNIIETVRKFCLMSGEALSNDPQIKFNAEQASLVTQFIGEWTFHKSIDLINGKIPPQNRESILQVLAANIFQTAKLALIKNMPQDTLITLVENKVKQVYADELQKLVKKGVLSPQQYEMAVNTSNLNNMVEKAETTSKAEGQTPTPPVTNDRKVLKLAALAMVLKKLPNEKINEILSTLDKKDVQHVLNYMKMPNIEEKLDRQVILKAVEEIKQVLPKSDRIDVKRLLKKYTKLVKETPIEILSEIALNERDTVKDFILKPDFSTSENFTPKVLQTLIGILEEKINDYKKEIHANQAN